MEKKVIYKSVIIQIVGSTGNWDYAYYPDDKEFKTHQEARRCGIKTHEHDDFLTAEFQKRKCTAIYMYEKRHTEKSKVHGDYVRGINKELGI